MANSWTGPRRLTSTPVDGARPVVAESRSLLYPNRLAAEFGLQAGKVQNLRIAARFLNGTTIPAGETFSFWAQVPRPNRRTGFVEGRELREGCVIPSVGGGLCQLSNALYDAVLKAGFEIVERHGHSRILPGSMAEAGRDATVFWNYVDLRFRPPFNTQLEVILGRGELVVRFRGESRVSPSRNPGDTSPTHARSGDAAESCETCGVTSCFRHPEAMELPQASVTAWLLDGFSPEIDAHVRAHRRDGDWLLIPPDVAREPWSIPGFAEVRQPAFPTRSNPPGNRNRWLARAYSDLLPFAATHLVISQNLLPHLWLDGVLGGRTFDVLTNEPPDRPFHEDAEIDEAMKASLAEARHLVDFATAQA